MVTHEWWRSCGAKGCKELETTVLEVFTSGCIPITEDNSEFRTLLSNRNIVQATNVNHVCNEHFSSSYIFIMETGKSNQHIQNIVTSTYNQHYKIMMFIFFFILSLRNSNFALIASSDQPHLKCLWSHMVGGHPAGRHRSRMGSLVAPKAGSSKEGLIQDKVLKPTKSKSYLFRKISSSSSLH